MKCTTLGIDLAKSVFQLHGVEKRGQVVQKRVRRNQRLETVAQLPACVIGMETCASAHYWAREFHQRGHTRMVRACFLTWPFEAVVLLRRARADSIRAGMSSDFPATPHICPQLILPCLPRSSPCKRERSIYVTTRPPCPP